MKAFIIHLPKIESSLNSAVQVFRTLSSYGIEAHLFEGTYGNDAKELFKKDERKIAKYSIKTELISPNEFKSRFPDEPIPENAVGISIRKLLDHTNPKVLKTIRPGVVGCFYSHYRLWQKCIELNEPILIFEDDVLFEREFIPVEWEEVLLLCTGKEAHEHEFYSPKLYAPTGEPCAVDLPNTSMPGAVGYGLTPAGAAKLVEYYKKEYLPADVALNQFVVRLQCHNYLMGRAAIASDGKESLTKSKMWDQ